MDDPLIAAREPTALTLKPGIYLWCRCGRSKNQPFCDDSHIDTEFTPLRFEVTEERKRTYCNCKRTDDSPYCDGTHKSL
jgi:CDGSH-type Zn-finger protein